MKLRINYFFIVAILMSLTYSCSFEKRDWEEAKKVNTIQAYQAFLKQHPKGELADSAKYSLELAYFEKAKSSNTIQASEEYLKRYPKGRFAEKAQASIMSGDGPFL